jgi:hypothetical protein
MHDNKINLANVVYRTDIEPLKNHFPDIDGIMAAFWKSGTFGSTCIGPSDTWLKGFMLLNDTTLDVIQSGCDDWSEVGITFEEGIEPDVTSFNNFRWYSSKNFSKRMNKSVFMGDYYLDKRNGVLYFDLSTY